MPADTPSPNRIDPNPNNWPDRAKPLTIEDETLLFRICNRHASHFGVSCTLVAWYKMVAADLARALGRPYRWEPTRRRIKAITQRRLQCPGRFEQWGQQVPNLGRTIDPTNHWTLQLMAEVDQWIPTWQRWEEKTKACKHGRRFKGRKGHKHGTADPDHHPTPTRPDSVADSATPGTHTSGADPCRRRESYIYPPPKGTSPSEAITQIPDSAPPPILVPVDNPAPKPGHQPSTPVPAPPTSVILSLNFPGESPRVPVQVDVLVNPY
ncbi:hypothetical protein NUU61_001607 [Penicillium alfredii]|uniref:Uncharacterized protein n=1 Tax=Penicillium alfredii TaxID=1506179 RepID=A0A9W9G1G5_9EURO|nr:uncharacterized protein NUU61_001607 [Penicillium alfredii]KAJ5110350.1 hypothetical protein NUU61_001607 [Penicillium alfredii]